LLGVFAAAWAALIAQSSFTPKTNLLNSPRTNLVWTETSVQDFRDGMLDPTMYVSRRAGLDPDSGCVEFFSRFDVDNNGYLDLVCSDDSGPYLRLYFGSASGYDSSRSRYYAVPGGGNCDLADLNLDGHAELVHSGWRSGHATIYWGTDSGPSPTDTTWLGISGQSEAVAVYDLDRDSYLDVLVGSDNGNLYIFWGSATGYSGTNRTSVYVGGSVGHNIEVADFDRDGYGDIALSLWSRDRNPVIYWGAGRTPRTIVWLQVASNNPHGITVADLDLDGWLDVVYTGYDQVTAAYIYYGSPTGFSVNRRETINPGKCYGGSSAVLWNADKTLDLVFFRGEWGMDTTFRPKVFYNRADTFPHFSNARSAEIGDSMFNSSGGLIADLNYDGYLDVFVNNMRPDNHSEVLWGPDYTNATSLPVDRDHHGLWREIGSIYTRGFEATYVSSVFDVGPDSAIGGGTCSWLASEPDGSEVMIEVRSGNTVVPDSTWTEFYPIPFNGGEIPDVVVDSRYLQYRALFYYVRPSYLPSLEEVTFDLSTTLAVDVGVTRILAPVGTVDSGAAVAPMAVIRNFEPSEPVVRLNLRIGPTYNRTLTDTMVSLGVDTVIFPTWTATPLGSFNVRCSVYAAHDWARANDTLSDTVRVRAHEDVGPLAILSPPAVAESGTVHTPSVTVHNFGARAEIFPVHVEIGSGYSQVLSDTLSPDQTDTMAFPAWTASPVGPQTVRCYTALTNDGNETNDTITQATTVYVNIDAAAVAIMTPTDTVDSGATIAPQARVANFGTSAALVPVRMAIGSGYNETASVTVQPGETTTVSFADWTASPVGLLAVRCSTRLAGDTTTGNDLATDSVVVVVHKDAKAVAILAPTGTVDSGTAMTPVCRIGNDGASPDLIPVRLRIGTDYDQTMTKFLNPGAVDTVHFPDWVASPLGLVSVQCSTALAGDENPSNDTVSTTVLVSVVIDAAAQAILAPTDTADTGTAIIPVCRVTNLSTSPKTIPVWLGIGSGYLQNRDKLVAPGASDTVSFPAWTASPVGVLAVRCSTALAGDTFPANDTVSTTVTVIRHVDAASISIIAPSGTVDSGTLVTPQVRVASFGTSTADIPVRLTIGSSYADAETVSVTPGETALVAFADWTAEPVGLFAVRCSTGLTGDENPANDTISGTVRVDRVPVLDVGATAVLAPAGTADTGTVITPQAIASNFGNTDTAFPVTMLIGAAYNQTIQETLAAGGIDTVSFPVWTAAPCTSLSVICYTSLTGDADHGNDTAYANVTVRPVIDAGPVSILAPTGMIDSGTPVVPVVSATNLGSRSENIPLRLLIGTGYDDTVTLSLAPGQTDTFTFLQWVAQPVGAIAIRCSTGLADDQHPENDTLSNQVTVHRRIDAAAIAIIAPTDTVDSGTTITPQARVANLGTSTASIPVRMLVGTGYADAETANVAPNETATVTFADWTASPLGTHSVTCHTTLTDDTFPANDTARASVTVTQVPYLDAQLSAILAPTGAVDSGTTVVPSAIVTNNGNRTESVPVRMAIGSGYQQYDTIALSAGASDTVYFAAWIAQPVGSHPVTANTYLTGDQQPENDTATGSVDVIRHVDAASISIIAPSGTVDSGTLVTPQVRVASFGTSTADIPVRLTIGSSYADAETVSVTPGETALVSFADWTAEPVGLLAVHCSTALAGDENPANDTLSGTVEVAVHVNAAAVVILAPTGIVDTGTVVTPVCRIANYSTSPKTVPVNMRIGSLYAEVRNKQLAPSEVDTVIFPDWTAQPVGTHAVVCSTSLAGDENPTDDRIEDSVIVANRVDAAAIAILAPKDTVDSGTTTVPQAVVANLGLSPADIPVTLRIGSFYAAAETIFLQPDSIGTISFAPWQASAVGSFAVTCSTGLPGDMKPENDTAIGSVVVREVIDARPIAILSPVGVVDSGTTIVPSVTVVNHSSYSKTIPVRLTIGPSYVDTAVVLLAPEETDTVSLTAWVATPVGTITVLCSTGLAGDQHPENDTISSTVQVSRTIDAAVTALIAPTGAVDSGTVVAPRAAVANLGTGTALVPVTMYIGTNYVHSSEVMLNPGQTDTATFSDWIASPLGWQTVRCSTALAGDTNNANDRMVDSVLVSVQIDAAALSIVAPTGTIDSGKTLTPVCRIANYSTSAKLVPVSLTIGSDYSDTAYKFLTPGTADTVMFAEWTALTLGTHAIRCSTFLSGDEQPVNDTVSDSVTVTARIDAGVTAILAPVGPIDSGATVTPVARIISYSVSTKLVPVTLTIGGFYSDSRTKSLAPGQEDTVQFAPWIADQLGTHVVRCSTSLAGDENPENDTLSVTTTVQVRIDAAVAQIIAPSGNVDSGTVVTPQAVITNLGARPEAIPIHLTVATGYHESTTVVVQPESSAVVTFPDWVAAQVGTWAVTCSTALAGDTNAANDTMRTTVTVGNRHDVGCYRILRPTGTVDSGTVVVPRVMVANYGTTPEDVPVRMTIGNSYSDSRQVNLSPAESLLVSFAAWSAGPPGMLAVRCSTALVNDSLTGNDMAVESVFVVNRIDAAVTAILAPTGAVDSGTVVAPRAAVANLGTGTALVPVTMYIGTDYVHSSEVMLNPGQTDTATFSDWIASPLGWQTVRCSTALAGDTNNANDRMVDSVLVSVQIDAAALSIVAPTGTIDSGKTLTPVCRIANYSTSAKLVPVSLTIGSDYSDTAYKFLTPGTADTVMFAEWTALTLGTHAIRCSTFLSGDEQPVNDTVSDSVTVTARIDAGVTAILAPVGPIDSGATVTPVARIISYSVSTKLVPVTLTIGGFYSDSRTKSLAPGQEDTVQFAPWIADQLGTHVVRCSTSLAGDEDPENDTLSVTTTVRVRIDAAVLEIDAPVGTVDSGVAITPKALVANYSIRTQTIPVHMLVGTGYRESTEVTLAPGTSQAVTFPDWTAATVGTWAVFCSTALAGDIEPVNDTVSTTVTVINRHDVGCYRIVTPTGTVDSGAQLTPRAMVMNYGVGPELVPVRMTIGTGYDDSRQVNLSPGESVLVSFASWTASPAGMLAVRCSTALAEDTTMQNDLAVDSVLVVTKPDAAVTDIYAPLGQVDSGAAITPAARICNYGTSPVLVPVRMRIGTGYNQLRTKYLGIGGKDTVLFPDWIASPLGISVVLCSTEVAGDNNPANDYRVDSVRVGVLRDAAVLIITAPVGRVDSGTPVTPRAVVANFGTSAGLIPVRLRIGSDYDSVTTVFLPSGASDTVSFPTWTASPVGIRAVRCSTELTGENNTTNDYAAGSVLVSVTKDAACVDIQVPKGFVDSGTAVAPQALVANYGTSPAVVPMFLRIGSDYFHTRRKLIASGQTDTVIFPDWAAHPHGAVPVTCSTALAGDERNKNDAVHAEVFVSHEVDAAVMEIIVPQGDVDSGRQVTPKARIANYGANPEAIPVEMRIGDFYRSTRTKVVQPAANDTVHFDAWPAVEIGHHQVRCSTAVVGDNNPANDFRDAWADVNWRDAGCIGIIAPAGVIRAGTNVVPIARVRNFGSHAEKIPAVFRAGVGYAQLQYADSLAPGDSADLQFPEFTLGSGELAVSCSTALHSDMHTANDKFEQVIFGAARTILLEPDSGCEAPAGGSANYLMTCTNNGNAADTIDVTPRNTRSGWAVEFYDSTGTAALADHNGNGIPDLGALEPAASVRFVCRLTIPANELGHALDSTEVQATSGSDPTAYDRARLSTRVKAIANIFIEPDQEAQTAPGATRSYTFTITNLGNTEDCADLSLYYAKGSWRHDVLDGSGKVLGDRNGNGRLDIGPIQPFGGTIPLALQVTPEARAKLGESDTCTVTIQSFEDESVQDQAYAITDVAGAVTALTVEPDQTAALAVGDSATYRLWVQTTGNIEAVINLAVTASTSGWQFRILDEAARNELKDTDSDGQPDVGFVQPETRTYFTVRAVAPASQDLVGSIDSLFNASVLVKGSLSGKPGISDSAVLKLTAVPRFEVHNYSNPFSDRTRFILSVPSAGRVSLTIYNRLGERIRTLVDNQPYPTGIYTVDWDGTNAGGRKLAPGIYLYELELVPVHGLPQRNLKKAIIKR